MLLFKGMLLGIVIAIVSLVIYLRVLGKGSISIMVDIRVIERFFGLFSGEWGSAWCSW